MMPTQGSRSFPPSWYQLELLFTLKQNVDLIVRQLNVQNRLITRMNKFEVFVKDLFDGNNQIGLKRFELEYAKFARDYRHLNGKCRKMNKKIPASLIYDKLSDLFVSLRDERVGVGSGGGDSGSDYHGSNEIATDCPPREENNSLFHSAEINAIDFVTTIIDDYSNIDSNENVSDSQNFDTAAEHRSSLDSMERSASEEQGGYKKFRCPIEGCGYATNRSGDYNKHKPIHNIKQRLRCPYTGCKFVTSWADSLSRHQTIHNPGEKNYKCNFIGCTFSTNWSTTLYRHKQTHNPEKRYKCDFQGCTFASKRPDNIKVHKLTHTPELRFRCHFDGCRFTTNISSTMRRHIEIHNTAQKLTCDYDQCNYSTIWPAYLSRHKRKHQQPQLPPQSQPMQSDILLIDPSLEQFPGMQIKHE